MFNVKHAADPRIVNGEWPLSVFETDWPQDKFWIMDFWYDWFCNERYLYEKGQKLGDKLMTIINSPRFDKNKTYVFFKNNFPMWRKGTYDDFRICDIVTGEVLFTVINEYGSHWEVFGKGHWRTPIVAGGWKTVEKWFNNI